MAAAGAGTQDSQAGGGGQGPPIGIPTPAPADRVVQAAVKLVLEPILEADFRAGLLWVRPERRAHDAIAEIHHFGTL